MIASIDFTYPAEAKALPHEGASALVDQQSPVGVAVLVQHKVLGNGSTEPDLTPCSQAQGEKREALRRLIHKAKEDWKATDHPNWSIRDMDSAAFLDSHMQPGQVFLNCFLLFCRISRYEDV
jgi:hypothetical protein